MSVNWFPGHMNKAQRLIRKAMSRVDLVLEVLDARMPFSSENPLVAELRGERPVVKILNKTDLADPQVTGLWKARFERERGVTAVLHSQDRSAGHLVKLARSLLPGERNQARQVTAMILGVPNVGKSTLINNLAGRSLAKTSNKPAVTRQQQRVELASDFVLLDTPGLLWPKLDPPECGYRLAVLGSIADTALDYPDVARFAARDLLARNPQALIERYRIEPLPQTDHELLAAIAARRGCLLKGGVVDEQKVAELLVHEVRQGRLGRMSWETPGDFPSPVGD